MGKPLVTTINAQSAGDDSIVLWTGALGVLSVAAVVTFLLLRRRRGGQATKTADEAAEGSGAIG